ncbi:MAG: glycerophosphoryl diester phosphodiesterase membrane domain-containing protein, partial [Candidatus Dormiibacterota bacterium]
AAVVYVPYGVLTGLIQGGENNKALARLQHDTGMRSHQVQLLLAHSFNFTPLRIGLLLLTLLFALVALPLELAAITQAGADRYQNRETSFGAVFRKARERWLPLLGVSVLIGLFLLGAIVALGLLGALLVLGLKGVGVLLIVLIGLAAFVLGVMAYVRILVAVPVVVLEGNGPWTALNRSWHLSHGHAWLIFGVVLVIGIAAGIFGAVLGAVTGAVMATPGSTTSVEARAVLTAVSIIVDILVTPISALAVVLLYFNLRGRKEGAVAELSSSPGALQS